LLFQRPPGWKLSSRHTEDLGRQRFVKFVYTGELFMKVNRRGTPFVMLAATVVATLATIRCSSSSPTPPATTTPAAVTLSSILLSSSSVVGGNPVTGTATLNAAAPAAGAVVPLTGGSLITVPATVTVPAGMASAAFTIATVPVSATTSATISGSYGGLSASAVLSITPPAVATAVFGVTGPTETETCELANNGSTLNCRFDGSGSTATPPGTITTYDWSYGVTKPSSITTTQGPVLTNPPFDCSLIPPPPLPAGGNPWLTMTVTLTIHDSLGHTATATNSGVRLLPKGSCGYN
jgi:hypothetical protein